MGSIRETTEFGHCVKETGGWMWKVALWALSLALCCLCAPTFLPKCFQIMAFSLLLSWRHVKKNNSEGVFVCLFVCFFTILGRNPFFGITHFICQKNMTYHLQISREEITILCGFWLEHDQSSGGLKADVSMLLL